MLEPSVLLLGAVRAGLRGRADLVAENLPLRHQLAVLARPTAAWAWRQLLEAAPWGRLLRHLVRDRDAVYGGDFMRRARRVAIKSLITPVRAPRVNAIAERLVGTPRRECVGHLIAVNERHLRSVLAEVAGYCNRQRPHRTLRLERPIPAVRPAAGPIRAVSPRRPAPHLPTRRPIAAGVLRPHTSRSCGMNCKEEKPRVAEIRRPPGRLDVLTRALARSETPLVDGCTRDREPATWSARLRCAAR